MEFRPDCEAGILLPFESQNGTKAIVNSSLSQLDEIAVEGSAHREWIRVKFANFYRVDSLLIVPLTVHWPQL